MNNVASILGLDIPTLKARDVVMKSRRVRRIDESSLAFHRDSIQLVKKSQQAAAAPKDDDTASTTSDSYSDFDDSFTTMQHRVSFVEPLVTEVWTRPYTTIKQKYALFYCDYDYAEFRREAHGYGKSRRRVVKFSVDETVHIIPDVKDKSVMYYSQKELQLWVLLIKCNLA